VRAAPAVSCARYNSKAHTSIQVQRRHSGLPCAMVYGLLRALPGDRAFLPPSLPRITPRKLDTSVGVSGPHDFAVRCSIVRLRLSRPMLPRPSLPVPTFVTIAKRPSVWDGMAQARRDDLPDGPSEIFLQAGLDRANQLDRATEIKFSVQLDDGAAVILRDAHKHGKIDWKCRNLSHF
jgi:hypothetical protein